MEIQQTQTLYWLLVNFSMHDIMKRKLDFNIILGGILQVSFICIHQILHNSKNISFTFNYKKYFRNKIYILFQIIQYRTFIIIQYHVF